MMLRSRKDPVLPRWVLEAGYVNWVLALEFLVSYGFRYSLLRSKIQSYSIF